MLQQRNSKRTACSHLTFHRFFGIVYRNVANKATQQRLAKYQFEHLCGIEDGRSDISGISLLTKKLLWWEKLLPRAWAVSSVAIALAGRIYLTENECPWYEAYLRSGGD